MNTDEYRIFRRNMRDENLHTSMLPEDIIWLTYLWYKNAEYQNNLDIACANTDNIEIIKFMHWKDASASSIAMDVAASRGNMKMVKWLHENRREGCTYRALYSAMDNGAYELAIWLQNNRPECVRRNGRIRQ